MNPSTGIYLQQQAFVCQWQLKFPEDGGSFLQFLPGFREWIIIHGIWFKSIYFWIDMTGYPLLLCADQYRPKNQPKVSPCPGYFHLSLSTNFKAG
jgi:hypothetical protein